MSGVTVLEREFVLNRGVYQPAQQREIVFPIGYGDQFLRGEEYPTIESPVSPFGGNSIEDFASQVQSAGNAVMYFATVSQASNHKQAYELVRSCEYFGYPDIVERGTEESSVRPLIIAKEVFGQYFDYDDTSLQGEELVKRARARAFLEGSALARFGFVLKEALELPGARVGRSPVGHEFDWRADVVDLSTEKLAKISMPGNDSRVTAKLFGMLRDEKPGFRTLHFSLSNPICMNGYEQLISLGIMHFIRKNDHYLNYRITGHHKQQVEGFSFLSPAVSGEDISTACIALTRVIRAWNRGYIQAMSTNG